MHSLIKHDPTKWIIAFGFSSLLALTSSITFIALSQMDDNIESMAELVDITNAKITATQSMRESARLRGEVLTSMFLMDDIFDSEEMRLELSRHGLSFISSRDDLISYPLNAREQQLLNRIKPLIIVSERSTNQTAELILSDTPADQLKNAMIESNGMRKKVLDVLNQLIIYQNKYAQFTLEDSVRYHENTRTIIIFLASASFLFGILISIIVIRQTSRKNYEMQHQATHDALTQLINRKEFERRLEHAIETALEDNSEHRLCFMDLDQFKIINDTCGHKAGDQLLMEISKLLTTNIRDHDTLGRLGGDEFGLLLENCTLEKAVEIAECIVHLVRNYSFRWNNRTFHIGISIGLVDITNKTENVAAIMSEADISCYAAKDMGRGRVYVHELHDEHVKKIHNELSWVANIEESLKNNRFRLYVQPILNIGEKTDDRDIYEVLLRLKDDDNKIISPGEYIPAAERFNLMRAVDNWVVSQIIQKISEMRASSQTNIPLMFVNLSANSLVDQSFCNYIIELLQQYNIPEGSICFEITETAAIKNIAQASDFMHLLKNSHCLFALDDFGSGMSSFTYLKNLPVDYLKIDGDIVKKMDKNTVNRAMVSAINQIGRIMNIRTIAEHVENEEVLNILKNIGVDFAQGYHIGYPISIDSIIKTPE